MFLKPSELKMKEMHFGGVFILTWVEIKCKRGLRQSAEQRKTVNITRNRRVAEKRGGPKVESTYWQRCF